MCFGSPLMPAGKTNCAGDGALSAPGSEYPSTCGAGNSGEAEAAGAPGAAGRAATNSFASLARTPGSGRAAIAADTFSHVRAPAGS